MAESGEENVEVSEEQKKEAESVKASANEFFKGMLRSSICMPRFFRFCVVFLDKDCQHVSQYFFANTV